MRDKILKIWGAIGTDGLLHFLASFFIVAVLSDFLPLWGAALAGMGVGIIKEIIDKTTGKGTAERKDLVMDLLGVAAAFVVLLIRACVWNG